MRALYTQFSGLAGLLAFLNQLWTYAPIEKTLVIGLGTGLVVYVLLILGDMTIHRILTYTPPQLADETADAGQRNSKPQKAQAKVDAQKEKETEPVPAA